MALSESATERAVRLLVDTDALKRGQQQDPFLEKDRSHLLHRGVTLDREKRKPRAICCTTVTWRGTPQWETESSCG